MKCIICKTSDLQKGTTTVTLEQANTIVVFKGVPALVCDQCEEPYTDEETTVKLLDIVKEEAQKGPREEFVQYVA